MKLPQQDSATGRGVKTAAQAMIGLGIGLIMVVWAVPGVPTAVLAYIKQNLIQVFLAVGVPAGLTSAIWNLFRKDVPNY